VPSARRARREVLPSTATALNRPLASVFASPLCAYQIKPGKPGARQSHGVSRRRDIATRTLFQEGYQKLSRVSFCGSPLLNSYFCG
jgi:hypothetical protein